MVIEVSGNERWSQRHDEDDADGSDAEEGHGDDRDECQKKRFTTRLICGFNRLN